MSNAKASVDTAKKVQDLNAGWRNYLNDNMKLDKDTFQLAQGTLGLQTSDSSGLFRMADAVPPSSSVGYYDASTLKSRLDNYRSLLGALLPETSPQALQDALGDMYTSWVEFKADRDNWTEGSTMFSVYEQWTNFSPVDPGRAARGKAAIVAAENTALLRAQAAAYNADNLQTFTGTDGKSYTLGRYTATSQAAIAAINTGASLEIDFNSKSMDTSTSHVWVEGSASGFYSIFSGAAGASFEQLNERASSSELTISGKIGSYATLSSGPGGWYSSGEASRAFNGEGDSRIWDPQASAGDWSSFFGQPSGSLSRFVSQVILVSDYEITVTSSAEYSQGDFEQIKTQASFGVWPFFSASASSTNTTTYTLNEDSTLSVTQSLGKNKIQIWGMSVLLEEG